MAVHKIETNIDGARWEMNTLPATTGLAALTQIAAIIGAPAGAAAGGLSKGEGDLLDLDAGMMGEAVAKMTLRLAEPQTVDLVKTLLTSIRKNDAIVQFEDEFASNYGVLMKLVGWSIKENFGSFLAGNAWFDTLGARVQKSMQGASTGGSSA